MDHFLKLIQSQNLSMVNVHFYRIDILDFSGTRARSVGVDGKEINHKTTTNILRNFATLVKTSKPLTMLRIWPKRKSSLYKPFAIKQIYSF